MLGFVRNSSDEAFDAFKKTVKNADEADGLGLFRKATKYAEKFCGGNETCIKWIGSAEEVNEMFAKQGWDPPYKLGTEVAEYVTVKEERFVRFFTEGKTGSAGSFVAKESDVLGLTPEQIKEVLSLPNLPTHKVDVIVPEGTNIRFGIVEANFGGVSGANQFELLDRLLPTENFFVNITKLD